MTEQQTPDRENTLAEIEVRELLEGKRIMLSMTFHEASKVLLAELDREREESRKLREEHGKLIEGLRVYLADLAERHHEAMQKWDREADMYEQGAACAYDIAESMLRDILREIGVTVE